jgi:hypothetical protein
MQTRCLFEKPGNLASALAREISRPGELGWRNFFCKRFAASGLPGNRWVEPDQLRCMMVFDTQSKQFVGSGCYVVNSNPPDGKTAKFDTFTAEFVGNSEL